MLSARSNSTSSASLIDQVQSVPPQNTSFPGSQRTVLPENGGNIQGRTTVAESTYVELKRLLTYVSLQSTIQFFKEALDRLLELLRVCWFTENVTNRTFC